MDKIWLSTHLNLDVCMRYMQRRKRPWVVEIRWAAVIRTFCSGQVLTQLPVNLSSAASICQEDQWY